jgi:aryl-alcohol dehydrogenase-like predicted oxidoreductase
VDKERAYNIVDVLEPMAKAKKASVPQLALAWLLHQPAVTTVIIGANKMEQLEDNLKSVDVVFTAEELKQLDEVSKLPAEYPGWMLAFVAYDRQLEWPGERSF